MTHIYRVDPPRAGGLLGASARQETIAVILSD